MKHYLSNASNAVAAAAANHTSRQEHKTPILHSVAAAGMDHHSQHVFTRPTLNLY